MLNFLTQQVYNFLHYIITLFPSGTGFPSEVHTAVSTLGGYLHILDPLVPITTLLSCVSLIFGVEIAILGFKTVKWLISHIPFVGGRGN